MNFSSFIQSKYRVGKVLEPEGSLDAPVMIVGDYTTVMQYHRKSFLSGDYGRLLATLIDDNTKNQHEKITYKTNLVKSADHAKNQKNLFAYNTRKKTYTVSDLGEFYIDLLLEEIKQSKAKVIITLGANVFYAVTGRVGINNWRGSVITDAIEGKIIVPTISPMSCVKPINMVKNKLLIQLDIKKAFDIAYGRRFIDQFDLRYAKTYTEAHDFLDLCIYKGRAGQLIGNDIETTNIKTDKIQITDISFGYDNVGLCIPFMERYTNYWSKQQEIDLWKKIKLLLEDEQIKKCGQNYSFDSLIMFNLYGIKVKNSTDTMYAQHLVMPEYPKSLGLITSIWSTYHYYKDDGKVYIKGASDDHETFWLYNALDSAMCTYVYPQQLDAVRKFKNEHILKTLDDLSEPLLFMTVDGIKVDLENLWKHRLSLQNELQKVKDAINLLAGYELNVNSSKQLEIYFTALNAPTYKTLQNKDGFDKLVLSKLSKDGFEMADLALLHRKLEYLISHYADLDLVDKDGRLRSSYNSTGTVFSRLASRSNPYGTGTNMQNWPHKMMRYLVADDGYLMINIDYSQIENKIVAYYSGCHPMIEAFEKRQDMHRKTAAMFYNCSMEDVSTEAGSAGIIGSEKSQREIGKNCNHSMNYAIGPRSFSERYGVPMSAAKHYIDLYYGVYPEIPNSFHAGIQKALRKNGCLTNLMGRTTKFRGALDDTTYRQAYAYVGQSTVGDLINKYGLNAVYYDTELSDFRLKNQIHDSLVLEVPLKIGWNKIAKGLIKIKSYMEQILHCSNELSFKAKTDCMIGFNMYKGDSHELNYEEWQSSEKDLADILSNYYKQLIEGSDKCIEN